MFLVYENNESNPIFQFIGELANGLHKLVNHPYMLAFAEGVATLIYEFIELAEKYRFYDFPSTKIAIGNAIN